MIENLRQHCVKGDGTTQALCDLQKDLQLEWQIAPLGTPFTATNTSQALINPEMPTVAIVPKDSMYEKMISNIQEIKSRRGPVIAIATEGDDKVKEMADEVILGRLLALNLERS
mgnify:CR=1 FL=1